VYCQFLFHNGFWIWRIKEKESISSLEHCQWPVFGSHSSKQSLHFDFLIILISSLLMLTWIFFFDVHRLHLRLCATSTNYWEGEAVVQDPPGLIATEQWSWNGSRNHKLTDWEWTSCSNWNMWMLLKCFTL